MIELDVYRRFNLPLIYWRRVGDDPKEWKGPHEKGWNDPDRVYDFGRYDPAIHNVGTPTGRELAKDRFSIDVDLDKLNKDFVLKFFPNTAFALTRPGKDLSHLLYTAPTPLKGRKQYLALSDNKPYIELRGTGFQTMLPPSLHTPPDIRVALLASNDIGHVESLGVLADATLDYSIAMLIAEALPGGVHHEHRMALAGYLLKRQFDEERVRTLLKTICDYQVKVNVPDMSCRDIDDVDDVVKSTVERLAHGEKVKGSGFLKEVNEDFVKRLRTFLPPWQGPVGVDDFYAYMPQHNYLFIPSREFWPAASVNARIVPIVTGTDDNGKETTVAANVWLDRNRPAEQLTWAPGFPLLIRDRLVAEGGWIDRPGCSCVNLYRPPTIALGDAALAEPWVELLRYLYPNEADHILAWCAHRVQRPQEKINHALVLGGAPGIGKDSILEPVKTAVGPWNFVEVCPADFFRDFNGYVKSVVLRISEVRDLGEVNRYAFYEHMKAYTAAPPDVLRCNEKNTHEYSVPNVCGPVYTTNHESDAMYLPFDDRRHFVAWSMRTSLDFKEVYWKQLYAWYDNGGRGHVAAYLASYDLTQFDPKAPPTKTDAFWTIVDANRPTEDAELADVLDTCGNPPAVTLLMVSKACNAGLANWLLDRTNSRQIPHRMKTAGYVAYRNPAAKDGQWKIGGRRQTVYVKETFSVCERAEAAGNLANAKG